MSEICAILFCEFDSVVGPKLSFVASTSKWMDCFDSCSAYLIPKPKYCGTIVSFLKNNQRIIGFPVLLEDQKYPRNTALWNVAFVLPILDPIPFYPIVRKIATTFKYLELESQFVTKTESRKQLHTVLMQILVDLNTFRESRVQINNENYLDLKIFPILKKPKKINFWDVPVLEIDVTKLCVEQWDLTIQRILPFINGVNPIQIISEKAMVDFDLVMSAIEHLMYYSAVQIIDFFQMTNIYVCTNNISKLAVDETLQQTCIHYVTKPGSVESTPTRLFYLYSLLKLGQNLTEYVKSSIFPQTIDLRRFVVFGIINNIIRRVHLYPMLEKQQFSAVFGTEEQSNLPLDALCIRFKQSAFDLLQVLMKNNVLILSK